MWKRIVFFMEKDTGKNWYCEVDGIKITVNAHSYTIITAYRCQH
ncbi:MAG: DUF3781 domain-containing protein [Lachnospiraceae bacterium]|nr:DUF3781 domain-containing protein [Lachnospiraceae bacterium]MDE6185716.1 DUF3781 domain-containing protein [Lachnospiraceae bacterium]